MSVNQVEGGGVKPLSSKKTQEESKKCLECSEMQEYDCNFYATRSWLRDDPGV